MPILRIEHPVPNFNAWKVMVGLEFGSSTEAEAFGAARCANCGLASRWRA